jgi:exportin-2 (importin alpha re-exporter)
MVSVPPNLQSQLGEAISVIADSDFYQQWETLVDDLVSRLTPDNPTVNNGVLRVAHSIFRRWRPLFRTDELFTEINFVLGKFAEPYLQLLNHTDTAITNAQGDPKALKEYLTTMDLSMKLFYDLSCQDLPPMFEDNLGALSALLHKYLIFDNPAMNTNDESESGILEYLRADIFEVLMLYVQKYEDAFGAHLPQFVETTWNFLTSVGLETKYDILVSKALQFLTIVANTHHAQSFNNPDVLVQIIEKVILPNITLRESDEELFEDEPIEFIRRDLEGADNDTRRRAATNFLRQLMSRFEDLVTGTAQQYIDAFLKSFASDKSKWKAKDTAVYLFSIIAAKGTSTAAQGVLTVNPKVNVVAFFENNIAADLQDTGVHEILKVDSIKYIYTFRSQLSPELWRAAFTLLVNQLGNQNYVIHTYAAIALERVLYMRDANKQPIIPKETVLPHAKELLTHLFSLITKNSAPEKIQENEFLMKCVMRVLIFIGDGVLPITDTILSSLINIIKVTRHNPSNPRFQYYMFEAIGALIRYAGPTQSAMLEDKLYDPFAVVLQNGVDEFMPYVFQLFAALLEANPSGQLTPLYQGMLAPVIHPSAWENQGNVPALVRLLTSMIARDAQRITQEKLLEPILGIFQKLVSVKKHESLAFDLIESIITYIPLDALQPYFVTILTLMLTRLSNTKTENFQQRFIAFYHFISARQDKGMGADFFIKVSDQVQQE